MKTKEEVLSAWRACRAAAKGLGMVLTLDDDDDDEEDGTNMSTPSNGTNLVTLANKIQAEQKVNRDQAFVMADKQIREERFAARLKAQRTS